MLSLENDNSEFIERFVKAFKALGGTQEGLIDYESFKSHLNEVKSSKIDLFWKIDEDKFVSNGKLDYFRLCASILASKHAFRKTHEGKGKNQHSYLKSENFASNRSPENKGNDKVSQQIMRGCLFRLNDDFFSNQYFFEIFENSDVKISVRPLNLGGKFQQNAVVDILLFQEKYKTFITASSTKSKDSCYIKCKLKKGKYTIVPILLNWPVKESCANEPINLSSLIEHQSGDQIILTPACKEILKMVFDAVDIDANGLLSQLEFDLFSQHSSDEAAADEWTTIEDNFKVENHQLTFDGFLELYKMVLQTDPADMINMLQRMGINRLLEPENVKQFSLTVKSKFNFSLTPLPVSSFSVAAEKILTKLTLQQGYRKKISNMNDLFLYEYKQPHRITIVVQNQSHSKVKVRLNCTRSVNCRSHRNTLDYTVELSPKMNTIGHHFFPINLEKNMEMDCIAEVK